MLLSNSTLLAPPLVILPMDSPCPAKKRLWMMEKFDTGEEVVVAPTATLSSPSETELLRMVKLVPLEGSMPSVLCAVYGVMILMPQMVMPEPPLMAMWKLGAFFIVILYSVTLLEFDIWIQRGFC